MFSKRKETIKNLEKVNQNLAKENVNLIEENKSLQIDLFEEYTKNIKLNTVLEQLITAICYSEDEKLLKTCDKILKGE